jgi:hypothetical protein
VSGASLRAWPAAVLCGLLLARAAADDPVLRWVTDPADPSRAVVEVTGLPPGLTAALTRPTNPPAEWSNVLAVYVESDTARAGGPLPSMLGTYSVKEGTLRFEPRFPLIAGLNYRAEFHPGADPKLKTVTAFHRPPAPDAARTTVARIYPSAATLPENLLKFYVHFSAPMSRGRVWEHLRLIDETGKTVDLPFLELDEELWDPTMKRLTVFIDPGRIKRGVRPLEEIGPALEAGKRYRFAVDGACRDATGQALARGFEKAFTVGAADRETPDPAKWKIEPPAAGTRDALVVRFPDPMDQAITHRVFRVTNEAGQMVEGTVELTDNERCWSFVPAAPWPGGRLQIVVPTAIEDLAGNNIGKLFDVDLFEPALPGPAEQSVKIPVEIR